jgi:enoyl-CoA hydratase/carnithine racemase
MGTSMLKVQNQGAVRWLTLHRPESLNSLTEELVTALASEIQVANKEPAVRVIVLQGSAGNFCSGLDLKEAVPEQLSESLVLHKLRHFQSVIESIALAAKPIIACVQGAAVGFGADLALACDLRVFGSSGYLQEKFVDIGLMPDGGGTFWLPRLVGLGKALELLLLGTRVGADAALALGLATQVVADDAVAHACETLAEQLCSKPPLALAAIKAAARQGVEQSLTLALQREQEGQARLLLSADFREGVHAWLERRPATFTGR